MSTLRPAAGLAAIAALAAGLGAYPWLLRTPPPGTCDDRATRAVVDAYRGPAVPLHLLALAALAAIATQMSRLRNAGRVGRPTVAGLAVAGVVAAVCLGAPDLFVLAALPGLLAVVFAGPLAVLAACALALRALIARPRFPGPPGAVATATVAWAAIFLALPAHLALVLLQGDPLFCF